MLYDTSSYRKVAFSMISIVLTFLLSVVFIQAIGSSSVTLWTPPNGTWFNGTNYTQGYNFSWNDGNDPNIQLGYAELFLANTSNLTELVTPGTVAGNLTRTTNNSNETIYQDLFTNSTFPKNNTIIWWTVRVTNESASPTSGFNQHPRALFLDNIIPNIVNTTTNIVGNGTYIKEDFYIEVNVSDTNIFADSTDLVVEMLNGTRVIASINASNATRVNLTNSSLSDDIYPDIRIRVRDPAGNINTSVWVWNVTLDKTIPTGSFLFPTPDNDNNVTLNNVTFNVTITDTNLEHIIFEFDGANRTINISSSDVINDTFPFTGPVRINLSNESIGEKRNYQAKVYVNDSANNLVIVDERNFTIDTNGPTVATFNWTISQSTVSWNFTVTDVTPATCRIKIYDRSGTLKNNQSGTLDNIGATSAHCTGDFNSTHIVEEGAFTVQFNVTDGTNITNQSTRNGVYTKLYSGWNLITYPDGNKSFFDICEEVKGCNKISEFNNTVGAKSFVTYSNTTPSVNNISQIIAGEAFFINVVANSHIITNDNLPISEQETAWNYSLSVPGWNTMGLLHNSSLNKTLQTTAINSTTVAAKNLGINVSQAAWFNATSDINHVCKRSISLCNINDLGAADLNLRKGYALWVLPEFNLTVNRSAITGR